MLIGQIKLGSDVVIADPCYDLDTWCIGVLGNVVPGLYNVIADEADCGRVRTLQVELVQPGDPSYELCGDNYIESVLDADIGVDSGTCGIYDRDYFESLGPFDDSNPSREKWYDKYVIEELDGSSYGVITDGRGAITPTLSGDGSYRAYLRISRTSNMVEGILIDYDEYYGEDEEEDDYDEDGNYIEYTYED